MSVMTCLKNFRDTTDSASNDYIDKHSTIPGTVPTIQLQDPKHQLNNNHNDVNLPNCKTKKTFKNALPQVNGLFSKLHSIYNLKN